MRTRGHPIVVCLVMHLFCAGRSQAQNADEQLWLDVSLKKNFSAWTVSTEVGRRALLSDEEQGWTSWRITPFIERSMTAHWDLMLGTPLVYTEQADLSTTFESRIQLGTRFNFTPYKRVQTGLYIRYEQRYFRTLEPAGSTSQSSRVRLRAEMVAPLDTRNYHAETMWYALADCEAFIDLERDANERIADRLRSRVGIGRKFTYNWRAEFIYCFQSSQRMITDDGTTMDNIFRFRLKYYFSRTDQKREPLDTGS